MKDKSCILTIKNKYSSLTPVEKKAADYILENSDKVIKMSVKNFAENAHIADSAVVRFSKTLGFSGYSDLKISLAMELSKNRQLNFMPYIESGDTESSILDKIFSANVKALHDTSEKLDRKILSKVIDVLFGAETIYIYAVGTSAPFAQDFSVRLMQLGFRAICLTDVANIKISTLNIKKADAVCLISHSGRTQITADALFLAKEKGAKTISVTGSPESIIAKKSDLSLCVSCDEINYPIEALSAKVGYLSLLDSIAISMSAKNIAKAKERFFKTHELVNTIRYNGKEKNNEN
ncbi:MAG: MurR/RpiR family transcriptional regulator [Clostridia bacterium]|nr:MurR/RpiR family transcriptional regulator [Clostridia bacterium]